MDDEPDWKTDFSAGTRRLLDRHGETLLRIAAASIEHGLRCGQPLPVAADEHPEELRSPAACFVTLTPRAGCAAASARSKRTALVEDVAENGFAAAFRDARFPKLGARGAVLAADLRLRSEPAGTLSFADEDDLLASFASAATD